MNVVSIIILFCLSKCLLVWSSSFTIKGVRPQDLFDRTRYHSLNIRQELEIDFVFFLCALHIKFPLAHLYDVPILLYRCL